MKKNLIIRSLTGAAFVALIASAILINYDLFSVVFLLIMVGSTYEFLKLIRKNNSLNLFCITTIIASIILYTFTYLSHKSLLNPYYYFTLIIPLIGVIIAIINIGKSWIYGLLTLIAGITYTCLPFVIAHNLVLIDGTFNGTLLFIVFILIWSYDTGAYLAGTTFGKHYIWRKISPLKSWEGAIGGAILTLGISALIWNYLAYPNIATGLGLGSVVIVTSTIGDFFESFLKRKVGVKDSGSILPGHGGLLDRFDSSLFAIPAAVLYLWAVNFI